MNSDVFWCPVKKHCYCFTAAGTTFAKSGFATHEEAAWARDKARLVAHRLKYLRGMPTYYFPERVAALTESERKELLSELLFG